MASACVRREPLLSRWLEPTQRSASGHCGKDPPFRRNVTGTGTVAGTTRLRDRIPDRRCPLFDGAPAVGGDQHAPSIWRDYDPVDLSINLEDVYVAVAAKDPHARSACNDYRASSERDVFCFSHNQSLSVWIL